MSEKEKVISTESASVIAGQAEQNAAFRRYLLTFFSTCFTIIFLVWAYTFNFPMLYEESGYVVWRAKFMAIDNCHAGKDVMLGDSRAQAAFIPNRFSSDAYNLSLGRSTPIDTYLVFKKLIHCLTPGQHVMVSISPSEFTHVNQWTWENGARYGFFSLGDLREIAAGATSVNDVSVEKLQTRFGSGIERDLIYGSRFPALYVNNLVSSRGMLRGSVNLDLLHDAENRRGFVPFGFRGGATGPVGEAHDEHFLPLPVADLFFRRIIGLANKYGIKIDFVAAPISQVTSEAIKPSYATDFGDYIASLTDAYPGVFIIKTPLFYAFSDRLFSDAAHVDEIGAIHFTDWLSDCRQFERCKVPSLQ